MTARRLPRRVFVDTSAFFALLQSTDGNHGAATSIMRRLQQSPTLLVTTNWIAAETHSLLISRRGRQLATRYLDEMDTGDTVVVRVEVEDEARARAILRQYDDKDFTLVDATSFAVMERLRIGDAFSFDGDFGQFGMILLTP